MVATYQETRSRCRCELDCKSLVLVLANPEVLYAGAGGVYMLVLVLVLIAGGAYVTDDAVLASKLPRHGVRRTLGGVNSTSARGRGFWGLQGSV
jgi:hypothetical protein